MGTTQIVPGVGTVWKPLYAGATCAPVNITEVRPNIAEGRYAIKRVVGDELTVSADVIKDGHDLLRAELLHRKKGETKWQSTPMSYDFNEDEWTARFPLTEVGEYEYTVAASTDRFGSWREELAADFKAKKDVTSVLLEGRAMIEDAARRARGSERDLLLSYVDWIDRAPSGERGAVVSAALSEELYRAVRAHEKREDMSIHDSVYRVSVDRKLAEFGSWYEMFPRSTSPVPGKHGTFRDAAKRLPEIKAMGFDVVYLPPIHPIGVSHRKGKNNALEAEKDDVGSPWAIGSKSGGHEAIHPQLGTEEDFEAFVAEAEKQGIEVAIDLAIQCSPDHPYTEGHAEWFRRRPDGTIKYAKNPPKEYQDIVQIDLWNKEAPALWQDLKKMVLGWIDRGVKTFRVDNPHTKPAAFWEWLFIEVKKEHPEVIFLAEAFTRPKKMEHLAKIGFSQSYTYFTWKNQRWELEQFMSQIMNEREYLRPNFFANTPDILTEYLQTGGRAAFEVRYALAGTLSPTCGIYSGYELCENEARAPGTEDYKDSEKYQIRQRDFDAPGNIKSFIQAVNQIRRDNTALQSLSGYAIHNATSQDIFSFSKVSADKKNKILVVANLDPHNAHDATLNLDGAALGLSADSRYKVRDLLSGAVYDWNGLSSYIRLDPNVQPVHIFRIEQEGV